MIDDRLLAPHSQTHTDFVSYSQFCSPNLPPYPQSVSSTSHFLFFFEGEKVSKVT